MKRTITLNQLPKGKVLSYKAPSAMVRSVPLSDFIEPSPKNIINLHVITEKNSNGIDVEYPHSVVRNLSGIRAVLIYLWSQRHLKIFTPIKSIYIGESLFFSSDDKDHKLLYEDLIDLCVQGKMKTNSNGEEVPREPRRKTIKRQKSCAQM